MAFALGAAAQYTPTPAPDETTDIGTGANIGCERAYGVAACGGSGGGSARVAPPKPDVWGALAITPGLGWGDAWGYKSERAASAAALKACQSSAGPKAGCKVAKTVADVCLSLVISKPDDIARVGGPIGASNFAEDNARLQCQRAGGQACEVAVSFCADGEKHVLQGQTVFSNGNPIFVPDGGGAFGRTTAGGRR
jgi:hypothetical protein